MRSNSLRVLVVSLSAAALAAGGAASAEVSQTPITTTCPTAFALLSVQSLEAQGPYKLPRMVDTAGNVNGLVCGHALPDAARDADCRSGGSIACLLGQLGLPLYRFTDDDNPASQNAQADA